MQKLKRRSLIGAGFGTIMLPLSAKADCTDLTPRQTMGPFYPVNDQDDKNWDLTQVEGRTRSAIGEAVMVSGRVTDEACRPVAGALVEIWQACASGKYNHPSDPNDAELDPDFQYWGQSVTDEDGYYKFKTIVPGDYPASATWQRPPHIHFRVQKRGYRDLVTQMYFAGNELNDTDYILQDIEEEKRHLVVIEPLPADGYRDVPLYPFDLTIETVRRR